MIKNYVRLDKPIVMIGDENKLIFKILKSQIENFESLNKIQYGFKQWTLNLRSKDPSKNWGFSPQLKIQYSRTDYLLAKGINQFLGNSLINNWIDTNFTGSFKSNFQFFDATTGSSILNADVRVITDIFLCFSNNFDIKKVDFSEYGYKTLRLRPEKASYAVSQSQSEYLQYQLKGGVSKYKRDISNSSKYVNLKWQVDAKGFEYLTAFYQYFQKTLKPFFIELHLSGLFGNELEPCMASFVPNTFKLDSVRGLTYTVSATIEVEELIKRSIASNSSAIDNFEIDAFR